MKRKTLSRFVAVLVWLLFLGGVLVAVGGFLATNSDRIEWVGHILNPQYYRAKAALAKIDANQELGPNDKGSAEIEAILKAHLKAYPANRDKLHILEEATLARMSHSMGQSVMSPSGQQVFIGAILKYRNQEIPVQNMDYKIIQNGVAELSSGQIHRSAVRYFWWGIAIILLSKLVETIANHIKPKDDETDNRTKPSNATSEPAPGADAVVRLRRAHSARCVRRYD